MWIVVSILAAFITFVKFSSVNESAIWDVSINRPRNYNPWVGSNTDILALITKPEEERWVYLCSSEFPLMFILSEGRCPNKWLNVCLSCVAMQLVSSRVSWKSLVLALAQSTGKRTRKNWPTKEIWCISSSPSEEVQKNKLKNKFRLFKFMTGWFPSSFFLTINILDRKSLWMFEIFLVAPFFKVTMISWFTSICWSCDRWALIGAISCTGGV